MEEKSDDVSSRIREKEEILRKMKMIKLFRSKHDTKELEKLIEEWLEVCQQALQDLEQKLREHNSDTEGFGMLKLLTHLGIEPELVGYSVEDETFTS